MRERERERERERARIMPNTSAVLINSAKYFKTWDSFAGSFADY
jgi:hypothetical protein